MCVLYASINENSIEMVDKLEEFEDYDSGDDADSQPATKIKKRKDVVAASDGTLVETKRVKLSKGELYKPLSSQEVTELRETESTFQSRLFKLQIDELLSEVTTKKSHRKSIDGLVEKLKQIFSEIPKTDKHQLTDTSWLPSNVKPPLPWSPAPYKGRFHYEPPSRLLLSGSYVLETAIKPLVNVDLFLEIPKKCLIDDDVVNVRYARKRALYLSYIASYIETNHKELFQEMRFQFKNNNRNSPTIVLTPQGKAGKNHVIHIQALPQGSVLPRLRLMPDRNNIKKRWYTGHPADTAPATPHYNNSVLMDLTVETNLNLLTDSLNDSTSVRNALILLKVWLQQRELDKGLGSFSGFIMSMFIVYLLQMKKINKFMSSDQIVKISLQTLADGDWCGAGISLVKDRHQTQMPSMNEFMSVYPVVFVDSTGFVNICADMNKTTYLLVKHEASVSVQFVDDSTVDMFQCLFIKPLPFYIRSHHMFTLKDLDRLKPVCDDLGLNDQVMDNTGDYIATALPKLMATLGNGLGKRIQLIYHQPVIYQQWSIGKPPPTFESVKMLVFGVVFHNDTYTRVLDRGPTADTPEAEEFRLFWGDKSEMRRFHDASVCEAVVWPAKTMAEKRLISKQVVQHLLKLHFNILPESIQYPCGLLESVLSTCMSGASDGQSVVSTGEEHQLQLMASYNELCKDVYKLKDLPLSVTSIQASSEALRYSEVFVPKPVKPTAHLKTAQNKSQIPSAVRAPSPHLHPLEVVCQLEGSGKWPHDAEAIRRVKAAFHIKLAQLLRKYHHLNTRAGAEFVDVYKDGYVFRIRVAYHKEVSVVMETTTKEGMLKYVPNNRSRELQWKTVDLPRLSNMLSGVQHQHHSYSVSCRLAKRWIASQLLSPYIRPETIELLMAHCYLHPAPYSTPTTPDMGFKLFLQLLSTHDWKASPLIVNLNSELKKEDYSLIESRFTQNRSDLALMFIAHPLDKHSSKLTQQKPQPLIMSRLIKLSAASLKIINTQSLLSTSEIDPKVIFRTPLVDYNVIIHLKSDRLPRLSESISHSVESRSETADTVITDDTVFPVVGFNPVSQYIEELEQCYGSLALFFYDQYGGDVVGVLWKPSTFLPAKFTFHHAKGVKASNQEATMVSPNIEAILQDFKILGIGLVKSVDARTENWTIT